MVEANLSSKEKRIKTLESIKKTIERYPRKIKINKLKQYSFHKLLKSRERKKTVMDILHPTEDGIR